MKILLDALQAGNQSGTGTYAAALARHLPGVLPEDAVSACCPAAMLDRFSAWGLTDLFPCSDAGFPLGTYARTRQMRDAIRSLRPEIVHYPANFIRLTGRGGLPSTRLVVTVHDLSFLRNPEWFTRRRAAYYRLAIRPTVRAADMILADSEATANDLNVILRVPPSRIVVTPLGVDESFAPADNVAKDAVRRRYRLPDRFFLYLGTIEPRKNLPRVIAAFDSIADSCNVDLVIAGREGWRAEGTRAAYAAARNAARIHFPGFIPREDMAALLSSCDVFVWPSLWEGFGLPPLEAMACGAPVITSSTSSLPEVVGDAAVQVDPEDTGSLASSMRALAGDDATRSRLRDAGLARARQFTWQRTAEMTASAYRTVTGR